MIVVKIELHSAITGKVSEIGRMLITNDGTGGPRVGNYDVRLLRRGDISRVQRGGRVENHARKSRPVWDLVQRALVAVGFGKAVGT